MKLEGFRAELQKRSVLLNEESEKLIKAIKLNNSLDTKQAIEDYSITHTKGLYNENLKSRVKQLLSIEKPELAKSNLDIIELQIRQAQSEIIDHLIKRITIDGYVIDRLYGIKRKKPDENGNIQTEVHLAGYNSFYKMEVLNGQVNSDLKKYKTILFNDTSKDQAPFIGDFSRQPFKHEKKTINLKNNNDEIAIRLIDEHGVMYVLVE